MKLVAIFGSKAVGEKATSCCLLAPNRLSGQISIRLGAAINGRC